MKKLLLLAVIAAAFFYYLNRQPAHFPPEPVEQTAAWQSGAQVSGEGKVTRILGDDSLGDRHQRFILQLPSGQTVLIAHNIDSAPRVDGLSVGDPVSFRGEYEWNDKGGIVHWTHHDPQGAHEAGWLKHGGRTYQ